ncbi:MAG: phosphohistidine phosphatase SixA [Waterburya sp.]
MEVYLVRHGLAGEHGTYADDRQRPLTNKGRQKTTLVAERLLAIGVKFDLILSSPLVRASQTAEILQQQGLSSTLETYSPLQPDGEIEEWLQWLQQWQPEHPDSTLALVGHQPDLGNWAEKLIWGSAKGQLVVKKAGVIGLSLPPIGTPIARSTLFLLTSPKWLI